MLFKLIVLALASSGAASKYVRRARQSLLSVSPSGRIKNKPVVEALPPAQTPAEQPVMEAAKTQPSLVHKMVSMFSDIYARKGWVSEDLRGDTLGWKEGVGALSGPGSDKSITREFRSFLENFIVAHNVSSVLDAGCGHWPSGYQRFVKWPSIDYHGVDIVPSVIEANRNLSRTNLFGLRSLTFDVAEVSNNLPAADLVIVKEVFLHVPNVVIDNFIKNNLNHLAPRFKYFMAVGMMPADDGRNETEDTYPGGVRHVDLRRRPFNLEIDRIDAGFNTVQLWRAT